MSRAETFISILLLSLTLIYPACARSKKPEIKSPEGKPRQFNSVLGDVFMDSIAGVDLTGLPKKLLYPGAKPFARYGTYRVARWGCSYNLETADTPEKVWAYYEKLLANWQLVQETETPEWNSKFRNYVAPEDKEVVQLTVTRRENKTFIVIAHVYNEL